MDTTPLIDDGFKTRVRDAYLRCSQDGKQVVRVDSELAYQELPALILAEYPHANIVTIDYAKEQPLEELVHEQRDALHDDLEPMMRAVELHSLWESLEEKKLLTYVLLENAQQMTVEQCSAISGTVVGINNSAALPRTLLYLPGGDWWYRPNFRDDSPGCGNLKYVDPYRISNFGQLANSNNSSIGARIIAGEQVQMNMHGPAFSNKTWMLKVAMRGVVTGEKPYLCIGAKESARECSERINTVSGDVIFIDHAERVPEEILETQRATRRVVVAASYRPLPGWPEYVDSSSLLNK